MVTQTCASIRSCLQSIICSSWTPSYCPLSPPPAVDVAIIGGGLSGLTAAHALLAAGKSVLVLEARERVGGKVLNQPLKSRRGVTEVGAEFVGPTQDKILALIDELGLQTFETYDEGNYLLWRDGKRTLYGKNSWIDNLPPIGWLSILQLGIVQLRLDSWAAQLNVSAPWDHPRAKDWDGQTFEQWVGRWAWLPGAKLMMDCLARSVWGAETRDMSLLYVLHYLAGARNETTRPNIDRLVGVKGGAQEMRVVGGTGLIPERLAERIGWENIFLSSAVEKVVQRGKGYDVVWESGVVRADDVVVALPPPLIPQIAFEPELPERKRRLNEGMRMGAMGKAVAIFDKPFWRMDEALNGQVFPDQGIIGLTFDNSPEDASFGAMLGFFQGDQMRQVDKMPPEAIRTAALGEFTRYFGPKAMNVTEFVLQRWGIEPYLLGGPTAIFPPGVLAEYGTALREPVGRIYFAGTETSDYWMGYMDGAVRSGQRVASNILDS